MKYNRQYLYLTPYQHFAIDLTPLQKLKSCKISSDDKYIVLEGRYYSTRTGRELILNEGWSISDILHTGADVLSAGLDIIVPGSGAIVDTLSALAYIIEAELPGKDKKPKSTEEKDSLYLVASISLAFALIPGPLQVISAPLKAAIKSGAGLTKPIVKQGLNLVKGSLDVILNKMPEAINKALKSPLAKKVLGNWIQKIKNLVSKFTTRIKQLLDALGSKIQTKAVVKNYLEGSFSSFKNAIKKQYPMSKDEAYKFIQQKIKEGIDPYDVFMKKGYGFPMSDDVLVATVLKNNIEVPVGKYLYHGTTTTVLPSISKKGLDNSLGKALNPGGSMPDVLGKGVCTASGDLDYAKSFAGFSAESTKGKEVILRFKNTKKYNMGYAGAHPAVAPNLLEYSYDNGKTWIKSIK